MFLCKQTISQDTVTGNTNTLSKFVFFKKFYDVLLSGHCGHL